MSYVHLALTAYVCIYRCLSLLHDNPADHAFINSVGPKNYIEAVLIFSFSSLDTFLHHKIKMSNSPKQLTRIAKWKTFIQEKTYWFFNASNIDDNKVHKKINGMSCLQVGLYSDLFSKTKTF